jgi:hypothetical protein
LLQLPLHLLLLLLLQLFLPLHLLLLLQLFLPLHLLLLLQLSLLPLLLLYIITANCTIRYFLDSCVDSLVVTFLFLHTREFNDLET